MKGYCKKVLSYIYIYIYIYIYTCIVSEKKKKKRKEHSKMTCFECKLEANLLWYASR